MAVESHTLGPGQLTLGATGEARQFGAATRSASVIPSAEEGDTLVVLDGQETKDEGTETWSLEGSVLQAYDLDSLIAYCAEHSGEEMPFTYRARGDQPLTVTGLCVVRSIAYGGEVKTRNTSDFKFPIIGKPAFGAATP